MKLIRGLVCLIAVTTIARAQGSFDPTYTTNGIVLEQKGKATMKLGGLVTMYDASLYLPKDVAGYDALTDVPKRLEIYYRKSFSETILVEGAKKGIASNEPPERMAVLQERLDQMNNAYQKVGPRDRYTLTYLPGKGTTLALNGVAKTHVPGADFAAAYFSIWLGTNCPRPEVRDALMGRPK